MTKAEYNKQYCKEYRESGNGREADRRYYLRHVEQRRAYRRKRYYEKKGLPIPV